MKIAKPWSSISLWTQSNLDLKIKRRETYIYSVPHDIGIISNVNEI